MAAVDDYVRRRILKPDPLRGRPYVYCAECKRLIDDPEDVVYIKHRDKREVFIHGKCWKIYSCL